MNFKKISTFFVFVLFLFQFLVWQLDIYYKGKLLTCHEHLYKKISRNVYFLIIQINTLPHLYGLFCILKNKQLSLIFYFFYLCGFLYTQLFSWWIPYFFKKGYWYLNEKNLIKYKKYYSNYHVILPKYNNSIVIPTTEHLILIILTIICLFTVLLTIIRRYLINDKINVQKRKLN